MDDTLIAPPRRGWWRRNAVALAALAILIPGGLYAFDMIEFGVLRQPTQEVAAGAQTEVDGTVFGAPRFEPVDPEEVGAPEGSQPMVIRVPITPGADAVGCSRVTLVDVPGERRWSSAGDLSWRAELDEKAACYSDDGEPYDLVTLVLLPRVVAERGLSALSDELRLDISVTRADTGLLDLRFAVG